MCLPWWRVSVYDISDAVCIVDVFPAFNETFADCSEVLLVGIGVRFIQVACLLNDCSSSRIAQHKRLQRSRKKFFLICISEKILTSVRSQIYTCCI